MDITTSWIQSIVIGVIIGVTVSAIRGIFNYARYLYEKRLARSLISQTLQKALDDIGKFPEELPGPKGTKIVLTGPMIAHQRIWPHAIQRVTILLDRFPTMISPGEEAEILRAMEIPYELIPRYPEPNPK